METEPLVVTAPLLDPTDEAGSGNGALATAPLLDPTRSQVDNIAEIRHHASEFPLNQS